MPNDNQKIPASLSIVMPAFNEAEVIEKVVTDFCHAVLDRFETPEFIIVDDHSTDETLAILERVRVNIPYLTIIASPMNQGHGPSLLKAFHKATGEYIFHADSDNQFYAEDFWQEWHVLQEKNVDGVLAYRGKRSDPFPRLLVSWLLRAFLFVFFGLKIKDGNCPFRIYRRKALNAMLPYIPQNSLMPSILMIITACKLKFRLAQVNVRHLPRLTGVSFMRSWKIIKVVRNAIAEVLMFKKTIAHIK